MSLPAPRCAPTRALVQHRDGPIPICAKAGGVPALHQALAGAPLMLRGRVDLVWSRLSGRLTPGTVCERVVLRTALLERCNRVWRSRLRLPTSAGATGERAIELTGWSNPTAYHLSIGGRTRRGYARRAGADGELGPARGPDLRFPRRPAGGPPRPWSEPQAHPDPELSPTGGAS